MRWGKDGLLQDRSAGRVAATTYLRRPSLDNSLDSVRRAKETAMQTLAAKPSMKVCWICGRAVSHENGKPDEHGNIVHEECYTARMHFEHAGRVALRKRASAPREP